jgi:hypothetical protein
MLYRFKVGHTDYKEVVAPPLKELDAMESAWHSVPQ